ncbi:MAG: aminoglycoside phosphotransferase family protein [Anaerolineae bacterium]|nr:aminoglycoside phosphotransferase family protein [Anaerolineae bacterium]
MNQGVAAISKSRSCSHTHIMFYALLTYLAVGKHPAEEVWQGWHIRPIVGGRNNLLYRATGSIGDFAIKFTIRDERDRAGREFGALTALQQVGYTLAPVPVLLDCDSYSLPVVVQTWLEGEVVDAAPTSDVDWEQLIRHLAILHTVTPDKVQVQLRTATINAYSVTEGRQLIQMHAAHIPPEAQPAALRALLQQFQSLPLPEWEGKYVSLIRLDNNTLNYIRRPGSWVSVDWENSGWGDPAFDIANLITHAAYCGVPRSRWPWVVARYCTLVEDSTIALRLQSHIAIMLVWWVVRMARYLYEMPRGLDLRLVTWSEEWMVDMQRKYEYYLEWAEELLGNSSCYLDNLKSFGHG